MRILLIFVILSILNITKILNILKVKAFYKDFKDFECNVCINALQFNKYNRNIYNFMLNIPSSCTYSTQEDYQKVLCMSSFIEHSKFLYNNLKSYNYDTTFLCKEIGAIGNPCTKSLSKASRNIEL